MGPDGEARGAVGGGWFGYLGYRLGACVEDLGSGPPRPRRLPDFELAFYDHLVRRDADGRWWFEALWTERRAWAISRRLIVLCRRAAADPAPRPRPFSTTVWKARPGGGGHAIAVEACRRRIHAGDLFQANLAHRLSARLTGESIDVFATAVPRLRPDRAAWLRGPWGALASLSPELFLERHGRSLRSAPIKGTAPHPSDPASARRAAQRLGRSAKDRAENVMIVDLVRNDLGRVAAPGSIRVTALAEARAHSGVWHLVSEVLGRAPNRLGDAALVKAAFPPGSVTGAPKVAALDVIAELESAGREVYTGAIGFVSPLAGLELSVAIRTFEFAGEDAWIGVGGGIVAESDPAAETAECLTKVEPLLAAIGGRLARDPPLVTPLDGTPTTSRGRAPRPSPPVPPRIAARPVRRPDPAAGVFETILVRAGRPVVLERHLARLAASVDALYGRRLPDDAAELVWAEAAAGGSAGVSRLRLTARPAGAQLELAVGVSGLATTGQPVVLRTVTIPGGLGPHKWVDRRLIEALVRHFAPEEPVFCDLDGLVLETSRSNVFIVDAGGTLVTPPVNGRLLPGVTRRRLIGIAGRLGLEVRVAEISLAGLARASEVFVSGSLSGVESVGSCDGELIGPAGPISLMLSRALTQAGTDSASPAASRSTSALFVCSQVKSSSSRPK
ncbi:MAG: para-aminobenzoate synthetase / 4-amino-4-deoxychorismate lyase [Solirubrobacteraceae bacterium]|nr:para-aminobenzoate synthetase / 4-amino-4-deoxychorismate lyase [Solirubrobacteraceae bacterium]